MYDIYNYITDLESFKMFNEAFDGIREKIKRHINTEILILKANYNKKSSLLIYKEKFANALYDEIIDDIFIAIKQINNIDNLALHMIDFNIFIEVDKIFNDRWDFTPKINRFQEK